MKTNTLFECGTCYHQSLAKDFTPVTASANQDALECPNCLNNEKTNFFEVKNETKLAA